eukprot:764449-Hanusia_phi.AAC.3
MDDRSDQLRMPKLYVSSPEHEDEDDGRSDEFQDVSVHSSLIEDANKVLRSLDSNLQRSGRQDLRSDCSDPGSPYTLDARISDWLDDNDLSEFKGIFEEKHVVLQQLARSNADRELAGMGMNNLKDRMMAISFARKALETEAPSHGLAESDELSEIIDDLWNDCAESTGDSEVSSMNHRNQKKAETTEIAVQCGMPSLDEDGEQRVLIVRKTFRGVIRKASTNCKEKNHERKSAGISKTELEEDQIMNRLRFLEESLQALQHGHKARAVIVALVSMKTP